MNISLQELRDCSIKYYKPFKIFVVTFDLLGAYRYVSGWRREECKYDRHEPTGTHSVLLIEEDITVHYWGDFRKHHYSTVRYNTKPANMHLLSPVKSKIPS